MALIAGDKRGLRMGLGAVLLSAAMVTAANDAQLDRAQAEYDAAFEHYSRVATEGGNVADALAEYRAARQRLDALKARPAQIDGAAPAETTDAPGEAAFRRGREAYNGTAGAVDKFAAAREFELAAQAGHAKAQYNLGRMLWSGDGIARDVATALHWMTLAAEAGEANAQFVLAQAYERGLGVAKDAGLARQWLQRAAAGGEPMAMRALGEPERTDRSTEPAANASPQPAQTGLDVIGASTYPQPVVSTDANATPDLGPVESAAELINRKRSLAADAIDKHMARFAGACFREKVNFGDSGIFREALSKGFIYEDATRTAVNMGITRDAAASTATIRDRGTGAVLTYVTYLPFSLLTTGPWGLDDTKKMTLWHEAVHVIERRLDEDKPDFSKHIAYRERNTAYIDHAFRALHELQITENLMRNRPEGQSNVEWQEAQQLNGWPKLDQLAARFRDLERGVATEEDLREKFQPGDIRVWPPELDQLQTRTGIDIRFDKILDHYATGACGDDMKAFALKVRQREQPLATTKLACGFSYSAPGNWQVTAAEGAVTLKREQLRRNAGACPWVAVIDAELSIVCDPSFAPASADAAQSKLQDEDASFKGWSWYNTSLFTDISNQGFRGTLMDTVRNFGAGGWGDGGYRPDSVGAQGHGFLYSAQGMVEIKYNISGSGCWDNSDKDYLEAQAAQALGEARKIVKGTMPHQP